MIDVHAKVRELVTEYWELRDSLQHAQRGHVTRRHKVVYTRWLEIFLELETLRPREYPLAVIERVSGRSTE